MTQETTNQIIAGIFGILTALLPPIVAKWIRRWRSPERPPPSPWAWFSIVALVCSIISLVVSFRARPPSDVIRSGDKVSLGYFTAQGAPGHVGSLPPADFGQAQFRIDKELTDKQKFTIEKQ